MRLRKCRKVNIKLKKIGLLITTIMLMMSVSAAVSFEKNVSKPEIRKFDKSEIKSYQGQRAFKYKDTGPQEDGLGSMLSYYIERFFDRIFSSRSGDWDIYRLLFYVLIIFGVIMLIFHFLRIPPQSLLRRSSAAIPVESIVGDNIHDVDFDKLIQQAAAQQNYRLAVRFWYLKMLKVMSDAELIDWQISKTNYDYYYELKQQGLRNQFLSLTGTFESSWYGNHDLSTDGYREASDSFQTFFTTITGRR